MTPAAILTLFDQNGERFSARNLATAVHRIGKLRGRNSRHDPRLARLIEMCVLSELAISSSRISRTASGVVRRLASVIRGSAARSLRRLRERFTSLILRPWPTWSGPSRRRASPLTRSSRRSLLKFRGRSIGLTLRISPIRSGPSRRRGSPLTHSSRQSLLNFRGESANSTRRRCPIRVLALRDGERRC